MRGIVFNLIVLSILIISNSFNVVYSNNKYLVEEEKLLESIKKKEKLERYYNVRVRNKKKLEEFNLLIQKDRKRLKELKKINVFISQKKVSGLQVNKSENNELNILWDKEESIDGYKIEWENNQGEIEYKNILLEKFDNNSKMVDLINQEGKNKIILKAYKRFKYKGEYIKIETKGVEININKDIDVEEDLEIIEGSTRKRERIIGSIEKGDRYIFFKENTDIIRPIYKEIFIVKYRIKEEETIEIKIKQGNTTINKTRYKQKAGIYQYIWDGRNQENVIVKNGEYEIEINQILDNEEIKRMYSKNIRVLGNY